MRHVRVVGSMSKCGCISCSAKSGSPMKTCRSTGMYCHICLLYVALHLIGLTVMDLQARKLS